MREKNKQKAHYEYLAKIFEDWYCKELENVELNKNLDNPPIELLERLNLDKDSFYEKYITPFINLSKNDLETVFRILAPELTDIYTKECISINSELIIKYDISATRRKNALEWLLFQVFSLNLFKMPKKLVNSGYKPYNQCFCCGKPDYYVKNKVNIMFSEKERFCHKDTCLKGSNPQKHDNCCYAEWTLKRKTLEKALKILNDKYVEIKLINKINKLDEIHKFKKISQEENFLNLKKEKSIEQQIRKVFIDFCEKQYTENLKIDYMIRTKEKASEPAINLKDYGL